MRLSCPAPSAYGRSGDSVGGRHRLARCDADNPSIVQSAGPRPIRGALLLAPCTICAISPDIAGLSGGRAMFGRSRSPVRRVSSMPSIRSIALHPIHCAACEPDPVKMAIADLTGGLSRYALRPPSGHDPPHREAVPAHGLERFAHRFQLPEVPRAITRPDGVRRSTAPKVLPTTFSGFVLKRVECAPCPRVGRSDRIYGVLDRRRWEPRAGSMGYDDSGEEAAGQSGGGGMPFDG